MKLLTRTSLFPIFLISFLVSACSKDIKVESASGGSPSVELTSGDSGAGGGGGPGDDPTDPDDPACTEKSWSYKQPSKKFTKMDLLFVVDTSGSMWKEHEKIQKQIASYMKALPANSDLNIGLLLGHGSFSKRSGKLHSAGKTSFIRTKGMSSADVAKALYENFKKLPFDPTPGGGEYLFYSYANAITGKELKKIQDDGFLRKDAVLTVIFVSDENDVCFNPLNHGYDSFPDYVPSITGLDEFGYKFFCRDRKTHEDKVTVAKIKAHTEKLKGTDGYIFGAITHVKKDAVPHGKLIEDSIGHGFLELVRAASPRSRAIEITDDSYEEGLSELARMGSGATLLTRFTFDPLETSELKSLVVTVDGKKVNFETIYEDDGSITVVLKPEDAGSFGSKIEITACSTE